MNGVPDTSQFSNIPISDQFDGSGNDADVVVRSITASVSTGTSGSRNTTSTTPVAVFFLFCNDLSTLIHTISGYISLVLRVHPV